MSKVSIIIPIYNIKEFMHASVTSAMEQSEADIEIILVDDGSTDGSGAVCDAYAEQDNRIRVIHKENGGLSSARNAGVAAASAKYVLFLDGDDYLHPQAVERLLAAITQYPSDIVQFQYQEVEQKVALPALSELSVPYIASNAKEAFEQLYKYGGVCASGCTKLFKKQLLVDIPFETIRHEDEMWCTRAFPQNLKITYIPDVLYGYITRSGSIIHSNFSEHRLDILKVKEARLGVLHDLALNELAVKEWGILFSTLFTLYRDAKLANAAAAQNDILNYFKSSPVMEKANITGRMRLFYFMARISKKLALELYTFYWKQKPPVARYF